MTKPHAKSLAAAPDGAITLEILLPEAGAAPKRVQLLPAGIEVVGRDGARWTKADPQRIAFASAQHLLPAPIDIGHALEKDVAAPAYGWIESYEVDPDGSIWGVVTWTEWGAARVAGKEFRYISPTFMHSASGEIAYIARAALTNRPRLYLQSINAMPAAAAGQTTDPEEDSKMKEFLQKVAAALGLPADATEESVLARVGELQQSTAAEPDLSAYVPKADHEAVLQRATAAETALATAQAEVIKSTAAAVVDGAIAAGKIPPASRELFLSTAATEAGLAALQKQLAAAPSIVQPGATAPAGTPAAASAGKLSDVQKAVCAQLGLSEAEYLKTLGASH